MAKTANRINLNYHKKGGWVGKKWLVLKVTVRKEREEFRLIRLELDEKRGVTNKVSEQVKSDTAECRADFETIISRKLLLAGLQYLWTYFQMSRKAFFMMYTKIYSIKLEWVGQLAVFLTMTLLAINFPFQI